MTQGMFRGGMPRSTARAMLVLAVVVGLLAGCSADEPEPAPTSTAAPTSAAPEPEPEPVEEVPEEPVAPEPRSGTPDERDAETAAEYFVDLYEYTLTTRDLQTWETRSVDGCQFCAGTSEDVRGYADGGLTYRGGAFEIEPAKFVAFSDVFAMFAVEVPYTIAPAELVDEDGEIVQIFRDGSGFLLLEMGYSPETGWMLRTGNRHEESSL